MALVEPDNDKTLNVYNPETTTVPFWQYNILYADGTTDAGWEDERTTPDAMRASLVEAQDNDKPDTWAHGDIRESKIIKRKITTSVTTSRTDWELA